MATGGHKLTVETVRPQGDRARAAAMPWWLAAIGGAVVCAAAGWAVIAAIVLLDQLVATGSVTGSAVDFASRFWLLVHGGVLSLGDNRISLIPLTLTVLVGVALHGAAGYAAKQAVLAVDQPPPPSLTALKVTATLAGAYAAVVVTVALILDHGGPAVRAGGGALILALLMGFFGVRKALDWAPQRRWPVWARAIPRSILTGVVALALGGAVALTGALWTHRDQFITLTNALQPGGVGVVSLSLLQLAWAVNLIIWSAGWTTGAGLMLADGSTISLMGGQVGLLPGFPITAALPSGLASWWNLIWLAVPAVAGALSAGVILRDRPRARFDETALVGGLAGVLGGAGFTLVALCAGGGLGVARLAVVGLNLVALAIMAGAVMGLAGLITGLIAGLIRRPAQATDPRWWSRWQGGPPVDTTTLYQPKAKRPRWVVPAGSVEEQPPLPEATESTATEVLTAPNQPDEPTQLAKPAQPDDQPPLDFYAEQPGD